ncbi:MAG: OmpA family protein [Candidatus Pacebacteria bacterium]|nr:OmpA family protein [Candidatus Paceibacterota bacterium]
MAAVALLSGCRTPKIGEGYKNIPEPRVREPGAVTDAAGTDIEWPEPGEWQDLTAPVATEHQAAAAQEKRWEGVAVYFAYDRATIGASQRPKIETLADYLKEHPNYYVVVEGHCDERGSDEYNRALGERRALVVRDYLVNLGIAEDRIDTVSYGEEQPAVPDATMEKQHAQNRRVEFLIGTGR